MTTQEHIKSPHKIDQSIHHELIEHCAEQLKIPTTWLTHWIDQQPAHHQMAMNQLLHVAYRYGLDPITEEVTLMDDEEHFLRPFITLDGWMKVLNQQAHFCGIQFRESSESINGIPTYVECTIYRDDRVLPITIKEYFEEIKTEHVVWDHLPRRMMRHRALQQCIRLAFGISCPERIYPSQAIGTKAALKIPDTPSVTEVTGPRSDQLKILLKQNAEKAH